MLSTEERDNLIAEARRLAIAEPILRPMLERKRKVAMQRLIAEFRSGNLNNATIVAELATLEALEREIDAKLEYFNLQSKEN